MFCRRGQFSLDFIFAIVMILLLSGTIIFLSDEFSAAQGKVLARIQLEGNASAIGSLVAYNGFLNSVVNTYSFEYVIPQLIIPGNPGKANFTVSDSLGGDKLDVSLGSANAPQLLAVGETITASFNNKYANKSIDLPSGATITVSG